MTKNFIIFILSVLAMIAFGAIITGFYVVDNYEEPTVEVLPSQKTMEVVDSYEIVILLVAGSNLGIHSEIYVIH